MSEKTYPLAGPIHQGRCDLFRLLAGHEVLGLAPGEIAKGLGVPPSWVSQNLPALATTGYVEQVAGTNPRWRLGDADIAHCHHRGHQPQCRQTPRLDEVSTLKSLHPDGVAETELDALVARLTVRSGLRVVAGGAA